MRHSDSSHEDSTQGRSWHSAECGRCMVVVHPRVTPNPGKSIKRLESDVDESNHTAQQRRDATSYQNVQCTLTRSAGKGSQ